MTPIPAVLSTQLFSPKYQGRNSVYYEIPQEDNPQILLATLSLHSDMCCYTHVQLIGLISSGDIFQRCMFDIFHRLVGVVCHVDNLLVYSFVSEDEHNDRMCKVKNVCLV